MEKGEGESEKRLAFHGRAPEPPHKNRCGVSAHSFFRRSLAVSLPP